VEETHCSSGHCVSFFLTDVGSGFTAYVLFLFFSFLRKYCLRIVSVACLKLSAHTLWIETVTWNHNTSPTFDLRDAEDVQYEQHVHFHCIYHRLQGWSLCGFPLKDMRLCSLPQLLTICLLFWARTQAFSCIILLSFMHPQACNSKRSTCHQWCTLPTKRALVTHSPYTLSGYMHLDLPRDVIRSVARFRLRVHTYELKLWPGLTRPPLLVTRVLH